MDDIDTYLKHAAALQGLDLDDEVLARVATVFRRNAELASLVMALPLTEADESAADFRPAHP